MGASAEYPDLPFIPPAAFGVGRPAPPRVIVIHYTAGAERNTSAEDGAAYDQRRTDGTSTHYFVDSNSVVQCVLTKDRANSALYNGNRIGIQYELCGTVQTRAQWLDDASSATLTNAARQIVRDCAKYNIPIRRLTADEVAAGQSGICGHADITRAFPADGGDHMDPGPEFPWDVLIARIVEASNGGSDVDAATEAALKVAFAAPYDGRTGINGQSWMAKAVETPLRQLAKDVDELKKAPAAAVVDPVALAAALANNEVFVRNVTAGLAAAITSEAGRRLVNG